MSRQDLEKVWSQVPPDYYEEGIKRNLFQKLWHTRKWMVIKKMIGRTSKRKRALDVGCASGWLTAKVTQILPEVEVIGLDIAPEMVKHARINHPEIIFVCADAHQLPFPDGNFDLIICTETLEHVADPLAVLFEIRRCLSPRGKAIISMDAGSSLFNLAWFIWTKNKGRVWRGAHLHRFRPESLKDLFKKANFKIEKECFFHLGMAIAFKLKKT